MIQMQNVSKIFRTDVVETHALRDLTLKVEAGEFVAITGHSGSGKTTFLNVAGLLEEFNGGRYTFDGQDVSRLTDNQRSRIRNEKIGFIFQGFNLIPDLICTTTWRRPCTTDACRGPSDTGASRRPWIASA